MGGGVLNCWAKKQKSVALPSWESELFSALMSGTRSLGSSVSGRILGTAAVLLSQKTVSVSLMTHVAVVTALRRNMSD